MLEPEQVHVTRCQLPVTWARTSNERIAHAVLILEGYDLNRAQALELLEGYAQPGAAAGPFLELLDTLSALDSTVSVHISDTHASFREFTVKLKQNRIVSRVLR